MTGPVVLQFSTHEGSLIEPPHALRLPEDDGGACGVEGPVLAWSRYELESIRTMLGQDRQDALVETARGEASPDPDLAPVPDDLGTELP